MLYTRVGVMSRLQFLLSFLLFLVVANSQAFEVKISPAGRVRYESLSDYDFDTNLGDYKSFTGSRFWFLTELTHDDYKIVFQPQFSRTWGLDEAAGVASGGTVDPSLNVHQAFFLTPLSERFKLKLGRQELSYGDELVLGSVIWSNVGRSFDAIKIEWSMGKSQLDLFSSKLSDRNYANPNVGDKDLHGAYFSGRNDISLFKEVDLYLLDINDSTVNPHVDILSYGLRLKGSYSLLDYRAEGTKQHRMSADFSQFDFEVGLNFSSFGRWAINYFSATEGYNQLFPTAHKWLGIGDVVSRRNLKGYQFKHQMQINDRFKTEVTYHYFDRYSTNSTAFSFSGAALGNVTSLESKIGDEYDIILNYLHDENLSYQFGAAYFVPGRYLKQSGKQDDYAFIYLQVLLKI
jgi:hypothetical protein